MKLTKDQSILSLLEKIPFHDRGWIVCDAWEADLFAIGIASIRRPDKRVYLSTFERRPDRYYFECERLTPEGAYEGTVISGEDIDFDTLIKVTTDWLEQ